MTQGAAHRNILVVVESKRKEADRLLPIPDVSVLCTFVSEDILICSYKYFGGSAALCRSKPEPKKWNGWDTCVAANYFNLVEW
jgi:hypothetical protein